MDRIGDNVCIGREEEGCLAQNKPRSGIGGTYARLGVISLLQACFITHDWKEAAAPGRPVSKRSLRWTRNDRLKSKSSSSFQLSCASHDCVSYKPAFKSR